MALTETNHNGEFLLSEGNGYYSRETVTFAATTSIIKSGTLIAKVTSSGNYAPYSDADSPAGVGVALGVLYHDLAINTGTQPGVIIARQAEVASARLTGSDAAGVVDLAALGIIVRS